MVDDGISFDHEGKGGESSKRELVAEFVHVVAVDLSQGVRQSLFLMGLIKGMDNAMGVVCG